MYIYIYTLIYWVAGFSTLKPHVGEKRERERETERDCATSNC